MARRDYSEYDRAVVRDDRSNYQGDIKHRDIYQERRNEMGDRPSDSNYARPYETGRDDALRVGYGYGQNYERPEDDPTAYSGYTRPPEEIDPDIEFARGRIPEYWGGHRGDQDRFPSDLTDRYGYGRGNFQERDIYGRGAEYYQGQRDYSLEARSHTGGNFRGRGPKGYERSDERILEDVCERLSDDPLIDASEIEVACREGIVTLSGMVESRTKKYRAEGLAADARGVKDIVNELRVATGWPGGASGIPREQDRQMTPERGNAERVAAQANSRGSIGDLE